MARRNTLFPRPVSAELIRPGDEIRVTLPADGGIRTTREGVVAHITEHGAQRHLVTAEGSVLAIWSPGHSDTKRYELLSRHYTQPMLELLEDRVS